MMNRFPILQAIAAFIGPKRIVGPYYGCMTNPRAELAITLQQLQELLNFFVTVGILKTSKGLRGDARILYNGSSDKGNG